MAELSEYATIGKDPIPGDSPAGGSVQYDEDYEAMRTEVQKLESVEKDPVDWSLVADTASDILRGRSKNLLAAVYLVVALFEKHDYSGLATGLGVCRDLVATYWETMEPPLKRKRGRIEAIIWLAERGGQVAADREPSGDEKDALEACQAVMTELSALLRDKLGDDAPDLGELQRSVKQYLADFEAAARAAEEKKRAAAARAASGEIELNTPDDARKALTKVRVTVKQVCDFLRKANNGDPIPYRLIRSVTWDQYTDLPPNTGGLTQIPAAAPEIAARLTEMHQKQDWANLVEGAEAAFGNALFWLDIHRWTVLGLSGLGPTHEAAAGAVMTEVAALISRLPELPTLKFANGTPFASADTLQWLERDVPASVGGGDGKVSAPTGAGDGPEGLAETTGNARRLAGGGQLAQAIRLMQEGMASTGDRRGQFLWRMGLAKICLDAGQPLLATPHLEELERQILDHGLESWEPKLCLTVYTALLTARRMLLRDQRRATPELMQRTNELQDRLCRLDAASILAMAGK